MSFSQWQEDRDYELMARYDYLNEAYGETARDAAHSMDDDDRYDFWATPEGVLANALLQAPWTNCELYPNEECPF